MVGKKKVSTLTQMKKNTGDDIEYGLARKSQLTQLNQLNQSMNSFDGKSSSNSSIDQSKSNSMMDSK